MGDALFRLALPRGGVRAGMSRSDEVLQRAVRRASVTRVVIVERDALVRLPQVLAALGTPGRYRIVADTATMRAAGDRVQAVLRDAGIAGGEPVVLGETPRVKPRADTARELAAELAATASVPLAVGAGVINDLTKYAASVAGTAYVCIPTAASMDGYAASGAAMLDDGFKRTLACAPPVGIVADLDVLTAAPSRMSAWGYGDLAGKVVAGADWLLADALGEEPIAAEPFALVQDNLRTWLAAPADIANGDSEAMRGLIDGLLVSGFAMQAHGNSRPASGSEHQFAHVFEMERLCVDGEPAAHGACVGVATVAVLALYEWFVTQDIPARAKAAITGGIDRDADAIDAEIDAAFADPAIVENARTEMRAKLAAATRRPLRLQALAASWPALRPRLETALVGPTVMARWLAACAAPFHPAHLGISLERFARDHRRARLIRRRYTILDCLDDLGLLDAAIAALFAPDGFWRQRASIASTGFR